MAQIQNILTYDGKQLLGTSINTGVIKFTQVKVGTQCWTGTDLTRMTTTAGATMKSSTPLAGQGNIVGKTVQGQTMVVVASYQNTGYTGGSAIIKEVGIYAALFESAKSTTALTTPILFSYLSYGDYGSSIVSQSVQSIRRQYNIPFLFSQQTTTLNIVPSGYVSGQQVATTATPNKLLYLNSDGKLPTSITGDAATLQGHTSQYFAIASHTHSNASTSAAGFLSAQDKGKLDTAYTRAGQNLRTTDSPTFAGLVVNGYIDGAKFR